MESFRHNEWGSLSHADAQREEESGPYDLYPAAWRRPTARETSDANQHRTREAGGGLGQPYDAEYLANLGSQHPLSVAVAAVEHEVRLA